MALALAVACACGGSGTAAPRGPIPPTAVAQDSLVRPGERHFAHLWQLTFGGENAEGYWSSDDRSLIFQSTRDGWPCDQEFVMSMATGEVTRVSTGTGRCTCGYFYDHDRRVLFASTHAGGDSCPPKPDYSKGYTWAVYPTYDLWTAKPDGSDLRRLTDHPGYDAEATVSSDGRWILFTSKRDGDIDLYKMHVDGTGLARLTHELGYDGGGWFSRDGKWICWRRDDLSDTAQARIFRELLDQDLVRPSLMNLWVMRADGSDLRQVTRLPGASFAPYFTPDGRSLIFASNWENPRGRNFDLYLVPVAGGTPEPVTRDPDFDGFPMFNRDGKWLVFASNRGGKVRGETNLFLAEWRR
jgi:Tol biopolymer transport system component